MRPLCNIASQLYCALLEGRQLEQARSAGSQLNHRVTRRYLQQRFLLVSCCTLLLTLFQVEIGLAQNSSPISAGEGALASIAADNNHDTQNTVTGKPPLPFRGPLVGPLVKRFPMDDMARRTTAFIPFSVEELNLTAIDDPQEERWIHVDLSEQLVVAYQNGEPIRAFIISSGLPGTPTVRGEFRIRTKVSEQTMSGGEGAGAYNLPGVKWVQYFYEEYSFHGSYWHSNFGNPMSHGCINMTNTDAKWLFDWAGPVWDGESVWYKSSTEDPGTLVVVTE